MTDQLIELVRLGSIEPVPLDVERIRRWIESSRRDVGLVRELLSRKYPERAVAVSYEAGYRACAGILALKGFRVRSTAGHHRVAIEAAGKVLGESFDVQLRGLDRARRQRNDNLYGSAPVPGTSDIEHILVCVGDLLDELARRMDELTPD